MSVRDFLLAEASTTSRGSGQKSDGACGSCGMSAEAMAAGEPCEHAKN
jgi:hypothetical protein